MVPQPILQVGGDEPLFDSNLLGEEDETLGDAQIPTTASTLRGTPDITHAH